MDFHSENDQEQPNREPQEEVEQMEEAEDVEEELCESAFIVEGIDMEAHKALFAACSAYFRAICREQKKRASKNNSKTTGGRTGNINSVADQSTPDEEDFSPQDIVITRSDNHNL